MAIQIVVTQTCSHRAKLEALLKQAGIAYEVVYVEEHPELMQQFNLRHSPNIVKDGRLVFRATPGQSLPGVAELKSLLSA